MARSRFLHAARAAILLASGALAATGSVAQGLAAYASPPRFEVKGVAGETQRHVVEIQHVGREPGNMRIYTNDWDLLADSSIKFTDTLAPDSCRPWVALERRTLTLPAGGRHRFRFEVTPPAGTPARECRFAIMIEGSEPTKVQQGSLGVAVSGRLAVIVYVAIGDAKPQLEIRAQRVRTIDGVSVPVLAIENTGTATGRLEGFLTAKDAAGRSIELAPEDAPILPGRTREIALREDPEQAKGQPAARYPLTVTGALEFGKQRTPLDMRFSP